MRPWASKLAEETDLSMYHLVCDAENGKVKAPVHDAVNLIPPTHKHICALDIDPSTLIDDEVIFKALTRINWATSDFQAMGEEEPVQDRLFNTPRPRQLIQGPAYYPQHGMLCTSKTLILLGRSMPCNRLVKNNDLPCHRACLFA